MLKAELGVSAQEASRRKAIEMWVASYEPLNIIRYGRLYENLQYMEGGRPGRPSRNTGTCRTAQVPRFPGGFLFTAAGPH
jgi:hypothetical protein